MNKLTEAHNKSKQLIVLDSTNASGLFAEDYVDILMLTQPHSLVTHLLAGQTTTPNKKLALNSQTLMRSFLKTILFRESYLWKKPLVKPSENLRSQQPQQADSLPVPEAAVLDLFDVKYSNPVLSIQDAHDIFYANHVTNQSGVDDLTLLINRMKSKKKFVFSAK